jgi:hypothetical protein
LISKDGIEIPISNQNRNLTYFSEKCFEISTLILKSVTGFVIPMSKSKLRFRIRNQSWNSNVEIETKIKIPISTLKPISKFRF